jgi:hypothetical protein
MKVTHTVNVTVYLRLNAEGAPRFLVTTFAGMEEFYGKLIAVFPMAIEYDYKKAVIDEIEILQKEIKTLEVRVPCSIEEECGIKMGLEQRQKTVQALQILLDSLQVEQKPQACASAQEPCPIHSHEGGYQL